MFKEKFFKSMNKFEICKDLYGKPIKRDWVARVLSPYKSFKFFQKRTAFVFTESTSRDQLLQKV